LKKKRKNRKVEKKSNFEKKKMGKMQKKKGKKCIVEYYCNP
jgi:hypothetical protein